MGRRGLSPSAVFALALLSCVFGVAVGQVTVTSTSSSVKILTSNGSIQIYPPVDVTAVDTCPDAAWKSWKLHNTPPDYNPLQWNRTQWKDYLLKYPLRSAALSIAFLLIGLGALLIAVTWRLVQWCVSCGHCQRAWAVGSEDTHFLGDTKHSYLKAWAYVLVAAALAMVVWGMLALDRGLMAAFWAAFLDIMDYGYSVSRELKALETGVTVEVPAKLQATGDVVIDTIQASRLGELVQASLGFNNATLAAAESLVPTAVFIQAALNSSVLPGVSTLAALYGNPVVAATKAAVPSTGSTSVSASAWALATASGSASASAAASATVTTTNKRRRLEQSGSTPSSYDTLSGLLPALRSSLPVVQTADDSRSNILGRLKSLEGALAQAQTATSPNSPELAALDTALSQITLTAWQSQLKQAVAALQIYNTSRNGSAFPTAKAAADKVLTGGAALSPGQVGQLQARLANVNLQITKGKGYAALKDLVIQLRNISNEVLDISGWTISLRNGTRVGGLEAASALLDHLSNYLTGSTSSGMSDVGGFVQAAMNASAAVATVNGSVSSILSLTKNALNLTGGGPDPSPAINQVNSALQPALSDLSSPVESVKLALTAYRANPIVRNLVTLRNAMLAVSLPVTSSIASFTQGLVNASALESTASSMVPVAEGLSAAGSSFLSTAGYTYDTLEESTGEVDDYTTGLARTIVFLKELPDGEKSKETILDAASIIQDKVGQISSDLQDTLSDAAMGLDNAVSKLQNGLLSPANKFFDKNQARTEKNVNIVYPALMAAWGLGALLVLLVALSVARNWPAGLVTFGLALLFYITLSQVVTAVVAFAMAVLDDACNDVEIVLIRQLVERANNPQAAVVLSHYLYDVPSDPSIMMQAAFGLNPMRVREQLASINETLTSKLQDRFLLQGLTLAAVKGLRVLGASTFNMFETVLSMFNQAALHALYANTKSVACCEAGNFAYHEWCAVTAMAALSFGILIPAAYLLARMDMLRQRRRVCCSCCSCTCYRPYNRYQVDMERAEQEDQFAKEARKLQELQELQHHAQEQASVFQNQPVPLADGNGVHHYNGSEFGGRAVGSPRQPQAVPIPRGFPAPDGTGLATSAPLLQGPSHNPYSAPSAPHMSAASAPQNAGIK